MNRLALLACLILAAAGCESHSGGLKNMPAPQADGKINGHSVNGNTVAYVPGGGTITGSDDVIFHISDPKNAERNFWVLLGSAVSPTGITVPGAGGPGTIDGSFNLLSGSAYLIGSHPWLTSGVVTVASEGTAILVEIYPQTPSAPITAKVMLVDNPSGLPVRITNVFTGTEVQLTTAGKYVMVIGQSSSAAGGFGPVTSFDNTTATHVASVKQKAITAGIPPIP